MSVGACAPYAVPSDAVASSASVSVSAVSP
jgi:hypothetical protein